MTNLTPTLTSTDLSLANAGGKGANLNRMLRAGLPVPAGFVITTDAYSQFVHANQLGEIIDQQWADCSASDPSSFERASAAIRAAFSAGAMPAPIAEAIADAYAALGGNVAVRSSATAEDLPEASFAGQQDTYLNVTGDAAVCDAVKRCWASLWTARAMAYRFRQTIQPADVSLAVVVQTMAPASAAGVLFTINPLTGNPREMVINAAWGLGEALVAGRVNPDTLIVDKESGRILQTMLGDKAVMTAATEGGVTEIEVDAARRDQLSLDPAQAVELARLGRRLEQIFAAPQDVEWAIVAGKVVLLQSRAVTSSAPSPLETAAGVPGDDAWPPLQIDSPVQPFDLWTTYDLGERWPEPVTPLTWSTGESMVQRNMDETLAGLKAPYAGKIRWTRRAFGHMYLNEGALIHAFSDGMGFPKSMIAAGMTGVTPITAQEDRWQIGKVLRHPGFLWGSFYQWERNVAKFERDFPQIDRWVDEFMARDLTSTPDLALWQEAQGVWFERAMHYMRFHSNATSLSITGYNQMESLMARWMGDKDLAQKLTAGLSGVIAAEIVPALWQMAATLRQAGLAQVVLDNPPLVALAQLCGEPAAQPFLAQFDAFLRRHGHRCMSEAEWLHPRWIEAPEQVIDSITGYLRAGSGLDASNAGDKAASERESITATIEARLNPPQRAYFRWGLKRLHHLVRARDNGQHFLVKLMLPIRRIYATLGERWAAHGWLADANDFFFLVTEEIEVVVKSTDPQAGGLDLHTLVADRRLAYRHWFTQPMPPMCSICTDNRWPLLRRRSNQSMAACWSAWPPAAAW
jgi:hypothetical protein